MMPTDSAAVLSGDPRLVLETADVRESDLAEREQTERNKKAWDRFIDDCLVEWGRDVTALEDEGFVPPSVAVVNLACKVAMIFRDQGFPAPTRVVPDGEEGISFERVDGELSQSLNIYADRSVELLTFDDCRLCDRHRLV